MISCIIPILLLAKLVTPFPMKQYMAVLNSLPPRIILMPFDENASVLNYSPPSSLLQGMGEEAVREFIPLPKGFNNSNISNQTQGKPNMKIRRIDPKTDIEVYKAMEARYNIFRATLTDTTTTPVTVFNPLTRVQLDELEMLRELSKGLQVKKDEDIRKQQQTAEEAALEETSPEVGSEEQEMPEGEPNVVAE